jgi:hypothetical protein
MHAQAAGDGTDVHRATAGDHDQDAELGQAHLTFDLGHGPRGDRDQYPGREHHRVDLLVGGCIGPSLSCWRGLHFVILAQRLRNGKCCGSVYGSNVGRVRGRNGYGVTQ